MFKFSKVWLSLVTLTAVVVVVTSSFVHWDDPVSVRAEENPLALVAMIGAGLLLAGVLPALACCAWFLADGKSRDFVAFFAASAISVLSVAIAFGGVSLPSI